MNELQRRALEQKALKDILGPNHGAPKPVVDDDSHIVDTQPSDKEIIKLEAIMVELKKKQLLPMAQEDFRKEAIARFAEIGFVVQVKSWTTNVEGVFAHDIEIIGSNDLRSRVDPDEQVWDVTHDTLGIDQPGIITDSGYIKDPRRQF